MTKAQQDPKREQRIIMEIVVDCYDESERAMGWYYYLQDTFKFPFAVKCIAKRVISPLRINDEIEVINMAPESECEHEMFVLIRWEKDGLAVPLSQLEPITANEQTIQAVDNWHYWVMRGYKF